MQRFKKKKKTNLSNRGTLIQSEFLKLKQTTLQKKSPSVVISDN